MLQKDLLNLEHLRISEVKEGYFLHVHSEDDWMITAWKEGDDIRKYVGFQCLYAPIKEEYPDAEFYPLSYDEMTKRINKLYELAVESEYDYVIMTGCGEEQAMWEEIKRNLIKR